MVPIPPQKIQPPSEKDRLIKFKLLDFSRYLSEFYQNFTKNNFVQDLPAKMFVFVFYVLRYDVKITYIFQKSLKVLKSFAVLLKGSLKLISL